MPSSYTPIVVPLVRGLAQDTSSNDARSPGIQYAENVDFTIKGQVQGRLGWVDNGIFQVRTLDNTAGAAPSTTTTATATVATSFTPQSMFSYRDVNGERLGTYFLGRVFTQDDGVHNDRLYCGASRVDRLIELITTQASPATGIGATVQRSVGWNFNQNAAPDGALLFGSTTPSSNLYLAGFSSTDSELFGGACDVNVGTDVYHCQVGNNGVDKNLRLVVRKNNDPALSAFVINAVANDCELISATSRNMDPKCATDANSASAGGTACLWVAYKQDAANNLKFLRVNPITGALLASVVYPIAASSGFWITSDAGDNRIYTCLARTGTNDLVCETHNATTLANLGIAATFAPGGNIEGQCVIGGGIQSGRKQYFAVTYYAGAAVVGNATTVYIGVFDSNVPSVASLKTYFGAVAAVGVPEHTWSIMHQPILVGTAGSRARTILGLVWGPGAKVNSVQQGATWFGIDITNVISSTTSATQYGRNNPGILAKGPSRTSALSYGPVHAIPAQPVNSFVGAYRFPNVDFQFFNANGVTGMSLGMNQVTLIQPRAATIGEETVLSGSVPHMIARGFCCEVGFPLLAPEIECQATAGGTLTAGQYTVQACWAWVDEAGVKHRSAFSKPKNVTTAAGNLNVTVKIIQSQLSEREYGGSGGSVGTAQIRNYIEVYSTGVNPVPTSTKFLQTTIGETIGQANQTVVLSGSGGNMILTGEPQYSTGGVFQNNHVSADGGVATVGRRMWMSDGRSVYASKLYTPGKVAPAWNDEGILQVNIPAPAGKVLSLERMDDKLVILCERGILYTLGDGPDDTGVGPNFLFPVTVSALGVSCEQGSISTNKGVVFHANNTVSNQQGLSPNSGSGGLFLIDRGLGITPIGLAAQNHIVAGPVQLAYLPENDVLLLNNYQFINSTTGTLLMLDMRSGNWSVWTNPNGIPGTGNPPSTAWGITGAAGVFYGGFGLTSHVMSGVLRATTGLDEDPSVGTHGVNMRVRTNAMYADSQDGLGWARVRSVRVLGDFINPSVNGSHTLTYTVVPDGYRTAMVSSAFTMAAPSVPATWPADRYAPEYRLPNQRASQITVTLDATPCIAQWNALRLDILPLRTAAPAKQRG